MELENEFIIMYDNLKTTMLDKINYIFEKMIKNVKVEKKKWIIQQIENNYNLQDKNIKLSKVRQIISNLLGINGKSISSLSKKYWIKRGYTENEINILNLIKKQKRNKSPMTINFWTEKGFTEDEAKIKIKSQRKCNKEYWINRGYSKEDAEIQVKKYNISANEKLREKWKDEEYKKNHLKNNSVSLDYWINKGFSEEEAKQKLKERQSTFSKEKCIAKYGEVEGLKRWQERQKKWQQTLNSK